MEHINSVMKTLAVEIRTDLRILFEESYLNSSLHHNNSHVSTLSRAEQSHYVESTQSTSGLKNTTDRVGLPRGSPFRA